MDAMHQSRSVARTQWKTWKRTMKDNCSLPVVSCIGNHDVWGWNRHSRRARLDRLFGKRLAMDQLGLRSRFFSFNRAGWHFIILDSAHPYGGYYKAKLDEEQIDWLIEDLNRTSRRKKICVLSHIPIICFCSFFDGYNEKSGDWRVPGAWMHTDARRIKNIFLKHKNVKLCLSGHIHMHDQVEYLGVKYLCNGAVCGKWWDGAYHEFPPAFVIVDLYDDGSSESEFITYNWK